MSQRTLDFSGRQRRDAAIAQAGSAAKTWTDRMLAIITTLAPGREFTTDLLWELADARAADVPVAERRAIGAVVKQAARLGLIVRAAGWEESARPACHARPCARWRRA